MKELKNIITWVDALDSGKYKQGVGQLGNEIEGFCCLGLACFVLNIPYKLNTSFSTKLADQVGLWDREGYIKLGHTFYDRRSLVGVNDGTKAGFKGIAKLIKTHSEWLFIPRVAKAVKEYYSKVN